MKDRAELKCRKIATIGLVLFAASAVDPLGTACRGFGKPVVRSSISRKTRIDLAVSAS
jgi:hypothetical protein